MRIPPHRWIILSIAALAVAGCGDDDGGGPPPCEGPECDAAYWMQVLSDSLGAIPDDPSADDLRDRRYPVIRDGFDAILARNPNDRVAHLGSGLLDVIELNYDSRLWAFIDSLIDYADTHDMSEAARADGVVPRDSRGGLYLRRGSPILRNQFTLLATAPRELLRRASTAIPSNLTVAELQAILEERVIPALSRSIDHMADAEEGGGPVLVLTVEDETTEIDLGEIYAFHAALLAARAGLRIVTAYDHGLPGPDGTYGWIDDLTGIEDCGWGGYFEPIGGGSPYYRRVHFSYSRSPGEASGDSIAIAILRYNLEHRSDFLTSRNDGMNRAFDDLLAMRALLEAGVAAIRAEEDAQEDDVIRIVDLTDLDDEITSTDPSDRPNFAQDFTTVQDVLDWVETVLSGPYLVEEDGDYGPITITVNLAGFFRNAPDDWKELLPYHRFRDPSLWLSDELGYSYTYPETPGWEVHVYDCVTGMYVARTDVAETRWEDRRVKVDPIEFTNAGGSPIDLDVEKIPHFPDYTLGGLFPGADRAKWLEIRDHAGW